MDGVENGVSLSDFAQQLHITNKDVPDLGRCWYISNSASESIRLIQ